MAGESVDPTIEQARKLQEDWLKGTADGSIPDFDSRQIELTLRINPDDDPGQTTIELLRTNRIGSGLSGYAADIAVIHLGVSFTITGVTRKSLLQLARFLENYHQRMGEF